MRRLLVPVLLALVVGCGAGEPSSSPPEPTPTPAPTTPSATPAPMPRFVGPADDGALFTLEVGRTSTLRIIGEVDEPVVSGDAVLLIRQVNITGSGASEWEIRAVEPGTSTVRVSRPRFTFTVRVR